MAAPNELSFLPDDYMERKTRRRTNAICAVLFFIVISAIGGAFTVTERSMREIEKQQMEVQRQYTDAAKRIEQVTSMQEKQRTMAHQAELTASLLEKVPRSFILAELTNGIPSGVSLLDFRMDASLMNNAAAAPKTAFELRKAEVDASKGLINIPVSQPRVYDVNMKINGVAETDLQVSAFITKLNTSSMFSDVNLQFTEEFKAKDSKLRKFQIELKLSRNARVDLTAAAKRDTKTASVPVETK
jgi:Tfp pilus assembly protein PilN